MGLAYVVVIQDNEGADSNEHVGTRRSSALEIFEKLKIELRDDLNTNEIRFEVWSAGAIVPHLTQTEFIEPEEDDEDEEEEEEEFEEEEEDYEDEEEEEEDDE